MDSRTLLEHYEKILKIRINHSYAGFFAYVTFAVNQLLYAEKRNYFPVVHFGRKSGDGINGFYDKNYGDNTWDYYFESAAGLTYSEILKRIADPDDALTKGDVVELDTQSLWDLHAGNPDSVYNYPYGYYRQVSSDEVEDWYEVQRGRARQIVARYVHPKQHVLDKVSGFATENFKDCPVLGVHMRGSDKGTADADPRFMRVVPPEEYFAYIDDYLDQQPDCKIFLATEQSQFVTTMVSQYGDRVVSRNALRTGDFGSNTNLFTSQDNNGYRKGEEVLVDCLLLARCDFLLKCTSAVGEYAMYFNPDLKCLDLNLVDRGVDQSAQPATIESGPDDRTCPARERQDSSVDHLEFFGPGKLIEGIVLINLDEREDRLDRSMKELENIGLDSLVKRMSAYKHEHGMYGCSVSHIEAIKFARWKGWRSVLILEDDIRVTEQFNTHTFATVRDLSNLEWSVFQFGLMSLETANLDTVTDNLMRYRHCVAAHAIVIHERVYDYILETYLCEPDRGYWGSNIHTPFDEFIGNFLSYEFPAYCSRKLLITQYPGWSDTYGKEVDWTSLIEDRYAVVEHEITSGENALLKSRLPVPRKQESGTIRFANGQVVLQWSTADQRELLHSLFGDYLQMNSGNAYADLSLGPDFYGQPTLWRGDSLVYSGASRRNMGHRIRQQVLKRIAARAHHGVLITAQIVIYGEHLFLFIANHVDPPWKGKGSDSSHREIASYFHGYVFFDMGNRGISVIGISDDASGHPGQEPKEAADPTRTRTGLLRATECAGKTWDESRVIVVLSEKPRSEEPVETRKMGDAEAALQLMGSAVNTGNLASGGLSDIGRLARKIPVFGVKAARNVDVWREVRRLVEKG